MKKLMALALVCGVSSCIVAGKTMKFVNSTGEAVSVRRVEATVEAVIENGQSADISYHPRGQLLEISTPGGRKSLFDMRTQEDSGQGLTFVKDPKTGNYGIIKK